MQQRKYFVQIFDQNSNTSSQLISEVKLMFLKRNLEKVTSNKLTQFRDSCVALDSEKKPKQEKIT